MVSFATPDFPKNSELLFGADWESVTDEFYQMVPEGGFRNVRISATHEAFVVTSMKTQVAVLYDKDRKFPIPDNRIVVGAHSVGETEFSIFGKGVGRTQVILFNNLGSPASKIVVSVKRKQPINCSYFFLTDRHTKKPEGIEGIIDKAADKIKKLYLNQANLDLIQTAPPEEFYVHLNLSRLEKKRDEYEKVIYLDDQFDKYTDIEIFLHDEINRRGGAQNKLNVLATWELEYSPAKAKVFPIDGSTLTGRPPPNVSVVQTYASTESNVCIWAHEMGHALGLGHQPTVGFLMSELKGDSWRLRAAEIDHINPTGLTF